MPRLTKHIAMTGKVEGTEGSDSSPAAGDGFYCTASPPTQVQNFYRIPMPVGTGKGSQLPGVTGHRRQEGRADILLRGAGTAYGTSVKPKADALLRACGFQAAGSFGTGTEKWDYTLRSSGFESFTFYQYMSGVRHKFLGCRGLPTFRFPLGEPGHLVAELRSLWDDPADAADVPPTGEPTVAFPVMLASSIQIGTENYAVKAGEMGLAIGRIITPREESGQANGYAGMEMMPDRAPVLTFEGEATTEAGFPFWAKRKAGTQMDCSFQVGGTPYNRIKVVIPAMQFEGLEYGDKNGLVTYKATCLIVSPTGGDDDLTITFD